MKMNDLKLYRATQINLDNPILSKKNKRLLKNSYNMNDSVNKILKICVLKNKLK